jgi:MtN3 and saliva related transmembrane protein
MTPIDALGFVAGALTTLAFVPQVLHLRRFKRADDLSWWTFGAFTVGVVLWLAYGLTLGAAPIIVVNLVMLPLALAILVLKWRYRAGPARPKGNRSP